MKNFLLLCLLPFFCVAQPGSVDISFDPGRGANSHIRTTSIQNDGKIIIGGGFRFYNGTLRERIARLNTDGSIDTSFDPGTGTDFQIYASSIQDDGKIIIGGGFSRYNGTARNCIARLNTDGSLDTSFVPGTGTNGLVESISIQSDGKIVIGGRFTSYNGTARNRIARLKTNGSLDTSFDPGTGADGSVIPYVLTTAIQSDGKIIIGGRFTSYNGTARNQIARLNADGSLDTSFDPGTGTISPIFSTSLQNDGKIIIGGYFAAYNGTTRNNIARLNDDGSLDISFDTGTGADLVVYTTFIQNDGKIIIGGDFLAYNGTAINKIARLNDNGSLDTSFDTGTGANSTVSTISIQSDGKIIITGTFTAYNGTLRYTIARINSTANTTEVYQLNNESNNFKIFPNPFSITTTLHTKIELKDATLTVYNSAGQPVKQITPINVGAGNSIILNRDNLPAGLYIIRLSHDNQIMMTDKLLITD